MFLSFHRIKMCEGERLEVQSVVDLAVVRCLSMALHGCHLESLLWLKSIIKMAYKND